MTQLVAGHTPHKRTRHPRARQHEAGLEVYRSVLAVAHIVAERAAVSADHRTRHGSRAAVAGMVAELAAAIASDVWTAPFKLALYSYIW